MGKSNSGEKQGFDVFWEAYPKHRDKITARRAFNRLNGSKHLFEILQGINRYMASGEWRDPQFIPYPATFLNGRRWEDEIAQPAVLQIDPGPAMVHCEKCGEDFGDYHKFVTVNAKRMCEKGRCPFDTDRKAAQRKAMAS